MQPPQADPPLRLGTKLGYAVGDLASAMTILITGFFLNFFLLEVAGLRPAAVGLIFLITNIWDAVIDPYIGYLSDRTQSRFGRKRVWLLAAVLPLAATYVLLWVVPPLDDTGKFFYFLFAVLLFKTALSAVQIPYLALSAIMAQGYNERTSLVTYRSAINILGGLVAIILHGTITEALGDARAGYLASAGLVAVFILAGVLTAFATSFERPELRTAQHTNLFAEFGSALKNRPFLFATGLFLLSWLAVMLVQNNLLLFMQYWANAAEQFDTVLLVFQVTAILAMFFWGWLARRLDKKQVYVFGALIWSVGLAALFFGPRDNPSFYFLTSVVVGLGLAVAYVVPWSMLPDVVDHDELHSGVRREGSFFGLFVLLQQIGLSLGLAASNFALEAAGYINPETAGQAVTQPDSVLTVLRLLVSFVPVGILLLSILVALAYPLSRERYAEVKRQLERQRVGS